MLNTYIMCTYIMVIIKYHINIFHFVQEVADFHDFCARNYGLTGGWSSKDHETFLKIRSKHVDAADFVDHVVQSMPRNISYEYISAI